MRILYVEASSGQVVGGSLTGLLTLIEGLDRSRYEPQLILYEDKPINRRLRARGIPVRVFSKRRLPKEHPLQSSPAYQTAKAWPGVTPFLRNVRAVVTFLFETLPAALRLARIMRELQPDLVHTCNGFRGNMDAIVAARLAGIPCIVHCKGFDKHTIVERLAAPRVAAAVCMTEAIAQHCRRQGIRPPELHVVYDGLDLASFRPTRTRDDVREELGLDPKAPVVGVVGNIQEWKGQRVLIEAMSSILESYPNAVALIVGGAHRSGQGYAAMLRRLVRERGLERSVVFTGPREDVADVMAAMDVVAHTSIQPEPFGRVIIEAMSVGRPVVATSAGGVPEFVQHEDNGLLVPPGDPQALAEALCRLLGDEALRERLGRRGMASVERFRIERHVQEITRIYETIAARLGPALGAARRGSQSALAAGR